MKSIPCSSNNLAYSALLLLALAAALLQKARVLVGPEINVALSRLAQENENQRHQLSHYAVIVSLFFAERLSRTTHVELPQGLACGPPAPPHPN